MGPCPCRTKLLFLYCAILPIGILTTLFLIQAFDKFYSDTKPDLTPTHLNIVQNVTVTVPDTIYSAKLNHVERNRLGFAIQPEFQVKPQPWQKILFEKLKLPVVKSPSLFSSLFNSISKPPQQGEISEEGKTQKRKKVLMYSKPSWGNFTSCPKDKNKNPEFSCDFIDKMEIMGPNISRDFDAIFVYGVYSSNGLVGLSFEENSTLKRPPKIIYFTLESPFPPNTFVMQADFKFRNESRAYLASYWRGSDIYSPYFRYESLERNLLGQRDKNYALGRSKMAAIVVSNCSPNNNRMGLVKELQKYVQVDVFGSCGTMECRKRDCFTEIKKNYKFYLAFENSNCRDYITEKLKVNSYGNDLLPIVFGAHPSDYKAIAPLNSYIHIEDFESIQQLGEYLHLLDTNDTLYNSYFTWKDQGYFSTSEDRMCEICAFLHADDPNRLTADENNPRRIPYFNGDDEYDFQSFKWSNRDGRLCLPFNEWYWNK